MTEKRRNLDRARLQGPFVTMLENAGIDEYGYPRTFPADTDPDGTWHVGEFSLKPHDEDEPDPVTPNFHDGRTGLSVWWYKYALRSGEANMPLDEEGIREMSARLAAATARLGATPYD